MCSDKMNFPNRFTLTSTPDVICPHYLFVRVFVCRFLFAVFSFCSYAVSVTDITVLLPLLLLLLLLLLIIYKFGVSSEIERLQTAINVIKYVFISCQHSKALRLHSKSEALLILYLN